MNRKGFTIIELMIIIAILGILAAILLKNFGESNSHNSYISDCMDDPAVVLSQDECEAQWHKLYKPGTSYYPKYKSK